MLRRKQQSRRFLAALALRLGFEQTEVVRRGSTEVTVYRGMGLKFQRSRPVAEDADDAPVVHLESLRSLSGYLSGQETARIIDAEYFDSGEAVKAKAAAANGAYRDHTASITALLTAHEPVEECEAWMREAATPEAPAPRAVEVGEAEAPRYAIFGGKTVAVVGFPEKEAEEIGMALAAQRCSFLLVSYADAEFRKGALSGCDMLIIAAPEEWASPDSLESGALLRTKKPALVIGPKAAVEAASLWTQGGTREFLTAPWTLDDAIWRASLLFGRAPLPKSRRGRKSRVKRIVIGDADDSMSSLVSAVLGQEKMECFAAADGASLISLARSKQADAIIADVTLPGLDGFQVLANIRRDPDLQNAVVILLTARQAEADVLRGFGLGADDYVTKPFSPMELAARLKRCLSRKP